MPSYEGMIINLLYGTLWKVIEASQPFSCILHAALYFYNLSSVYTNFFVRVGVKVRLKTVLLTYFTWASIKELYKMYFTSVGFTLWFVVAYFLFYFLETLGLHEVNNFLNF
ncbi:hypothetical protein BDF20DRAFT_847863 [Mycotypha africana]|uniref:uncharacterized protein n=1 Tax=Mycotypha africana TaxID=64632 RepID=UPI0023015BDF|nr:uncharacterized protein BDF20DRAFT_847863 [Mycotypha africana]KAI8992031.1 hypothetical protein BDF20DRAFT_847863 [Mycotypha africana]